MSDMTMDRSRVLVVDDEVQFLDFLARVLSEQRYDVIKADNGERGVELYLSAAPDVVLLDICMPEMDGFGALGRIRAHDPEALVITMTGYGSVQSAVRAMRAGAVDYLTKPLDLDHLEIVLDKALKTRRQSQELQLLKEQVAHQSTFEGLVGVCPLMQQVYARIRRLAAGDTTVLIQGETGTGKELVARAIHNLGARRDKGFIAINCGALSESILESELFGHERGAFTGATSRKYGLIEQAEEGTLFLDEVETMSPALQVKLLRAIQEREVLRVGGDRPIAVDFRLVTATNADLRERMEQGTFRTDLFYRLNVAVVALPALRQRSEDIPLLAKHFMRIYAEKNARDVHGFTPDAMQILQSCGWPGNVRELENAIEQAVLFADGSTVSRADLPPYVAASVRTPERPGRFDLPLGDACARFEREYLREMLARTGGRVAEAARLAGIRRERFYEKMRRHGIAPGEGRGATGAGTPPLGPGTP